MDINDYAKQLLFGDSLADKLMEAPSIKFSDRFEGLLPNMPARNSQIAFSDEQLKFPRGHFHLDDKKAIALSSFANHELLAIEMMAAALLVFDHENEEMKRFKHGIIKTIQDEQKHFKLYVTRLNDLGYAFGDFPINDFFWRQMEKIKTPSQYLATMALTFEAANLDFAHFYHKIFLEIDDKKTASILKVVYEDEISHVAFGVQYLDRWRQNKSLWEYYNECLPWPLSPARSKGKYFVEEARQKAKMDTGFIEKLKNHQDEFSITKRKEWK
jgi:uncharacterized ferritin-like protein (DUF455 family)